MKIKPGDVYLINYAPIDTKAFIYFITSEHPAEVNYDFSKAKNKNSLNNGEEFMVLKVDTNDIFQIIVLDRDLPTIGWIYVTRASDFAFWCKTKDGKQK